MIENFLNNFIKPQYRERLLYELKSSKTNKRDRRFRYNSKIYKLI